MKLNFKSEHERRLFLILLLAGGMFINQAKGQEQVEESSLLAQKTSDGTRIIISTSGPAKFSSHWLDNPPRLVVEFISRNILSKIDKEIIVNQGVIKRIKSNYMGRGDNRLLKSLTFELSRKMPCKIWQEDNTILLDIKTPLETPVFHMGTKEIFGGSKTSNVMIKRLEAMDAALIQLAETQLPLEIPTAEIQEDALEGVNEAEEGIVLPEAEVLSTVEPAKERKV